MILVRDNLRFISFMGCRKKKKSPGNNTFKEGQVQLASPTIASHTWNAWNDK